MATRSSTVLQAQRREPSGSRSARRLRREGNVPGVLYGGGEDPVAFAVNARDLRHALAEAGSVLDLQIADAGGTPAVLKELVRHPVNGEAVHIDLLRVRLDVAIQAPVLIELTGIEAAIGVREGGILEQPLREVIVEALPGDIPDVIQHDVSEMNINDTITLEAVQVPAGITFVTDPESVVATITPPRLQAEEDTEIETETGVVGEGEDGAEAEGEAGGAEGEAGEAGGEAEASE
ncbi:MAG TPA: 50S ribosomal protein L25 [Solirubrobacteraceae bacterium]|jgi:large subunit ribosomal protein L25|nr:50S ribosomal protein L25 [Solirubrobacteraceae bacterium]